MKVLNLLASGGFGGIEILLKDIILNSKTDNRICFLFKEGEIYEELKEKTNKVFSLKSKKKNRKLIVKEIKEYCIREKIDIVTIHHAGINSDLIYIMLKKALPNIKYVRYLHSSFDKFWKRKRKIKIYYNKNSFAKSIGYI